MREITERAAALGREVERQRFAGDDPVVALVPRLSQAEIVARVIAAERTGAALAIGEGRYSPTEDLAEAALREALGALLLLELCRRPCAPRRGGSRARPGDPTARRPLQRR
jgi:hypothetical protein